MTETQLTVDEEELEELVKDLTALAHVHRLRLIHLLTKPRYGEELAEALGTTRQNALKHVQRLEDREFVRSLHGRRSSGPVIEYQVVPQRLFALSVGLAELGALEPEGGPQVRRVEPTLEDAIRDEPPEPPAKQHKAQLMVTNGPNAGTTYGLDGEHGRWTIGREEDRTISIRHDPFVSSHHAEVQVDIRGHALVDVYSANGTFHNFKRLSRGGRVPLRPGDVISVGHTQLVYQTGE